MEITVEELQKQLRNSIVNYEQTVQALISFAAFCTYQGENRRDHSGCGLGRSMDPQEGDTLTPDLVAQKSLDYGIVAEMKRSLNRDQNHWIKYVEQINKYCNELTGWWTRSFGIAQSDGVLLLHNTVSRPFLFYIRQKIASGEIELKENASLVEFSLSQESRLYYLFRLEFGQLSDDELNNKLSVGASILFDEILHSFPSVRFYDCAPPFLYIMEQLWQNVLAARKADSVFDDNKKVYKIHVTVEEITDELQRGYGSGAFAEDNRSRTFPRTSSVRSAMDRLVDYRLAEKNEQGGYIVFFKKFKKEVRMEFINREIKMLNKAKSSRNHKQLEIEIPSE